MVGREIDKESNNIALTNYEKKEDYIDYIKHKKKLEESSCADIKNITKFKDKGVLDNIYDSELCKSIDFIYERKREENHRLKRSLYKKMGQQIFVITLLIIKIYFESSNI